MGVLDDAIRSHLELKRQHGASEDEVSKQEQEALGATRGQPVEAQQAQAPEAESEQPPVETAPAAAAEPEPVEPEPVEPPADPTPEPQDAEPEIDWTDPEPRSGDAAGDTPPRGFERVEDAPLPAEDAGDDAGEEDVLEETPDFLQETPEHDRLWFEQKPPRDFEFDE